MGKKLYVGNLDYGVTDTALEQMFAAHGTVESAQVIIDRDAGRSKGFGFVEMKTEQEARAARLRAVEGGDGGLGLLLGLHLHEAEALGPPGVAVHDDLRRLHGAVRRKHLFQVAVSHAVGQVPDV